MAAVVTDAIVLQCFPYGETSRIVRLLTREAGVQSAMAKGATRPRSQFSGLEPFAGGTATLHIRTSRELQVLGSFDLTRSRQALGGDLLRFGGASLLAELVLKTASEDAEPDLHDTVRDGLDALLAAPAAAVESTALAAAWHTAVTLGFRPELDACVACGAAIDPASEAAFDYSAGGLRCDACALGQPGRRIPAHARDALRAFCRGESPPLDVTAGHWRLLTRFLEHHLLEGSTLRSLQFIQTSLGTS